MQTVVLLHTMPDGGSHFDWMIERDLDHERRLVTWRCQGRPDLQGWDGSAQMIEMHRAAYLAFEGVLSNGRGEVARVARGEIGSFEIHDDRAEITIRWHDHEASYRGKRVDDGGVWRFVVQ